MKWLIRSALTLVTLILVGVVLLLLLPVERVAGLAADRFEAVTGRALVISGPVKATLWPRIGVRAEGIELANAEWSQAGPMLTADAMEIGIDTGSLFGGTIVIDTLTINAPRLMLERRADGTGNWEVPMVSGSGDGPGRDVSIDRFALRDGEIVFVDHGIGARTELRAVDADTRLPGPDEPLRVNVSALVNGQALSVEAETAALRPLTSGELTPVRLALSAEGSTLTLDGRADLDPLAFDGRIEMQSDDGLAFMHAFGVAPPDLPHGLGAERVSLTSAVTLGSEGSLHLRDMALGLDGNRVTGAVDVIQNAERPRIMANLRAERLDLAALGGDGDGSAAGWSRDPIDISALFGVDAEVTFASGPVALAGTTLDAIDALVALDAGRAVVTLRPLMIYGGTVTGDVVVNGRGGLSTRADLTLDGMSLQPLLTEFADFDRLVGRADASIDLLAVGSSIQALMDSLEGRISLNVGQGEILGLDVPGMIRNLDPNYRGEGQKTVFESLEASFAVAGGVARSEMLLLAAPYVTATGDGTIGIGARTISYRLLPTLRREADGDGVTVPILIEGPWSDARIRLDLEYLARQRIDAERAELEARARAEAEEAAAQAEARLRDKVARELDVPPELLTDRRAVEDAVRERVQDKLLDLLGNR